MELLGPVKESVSESGGLELRSSDPVVNTDPLKTVTAFEPEKSAEVGGEEGLALVSPQSLGAISFVSKLLRFFFFFWRRGIGFFRVLNFRSFGLFR